MMDRDSTDGAGYVLTFLGCGKKRPTTLHWMLGAKGRVLRQGP